MDSRRAFAAAATIPPHKFFSGTIVYMVEYTKLLGSLRESITRDREDRAETRGRVAWIAKS